jgi:hypothetical protein
MRKRGGFFLTHKSPNGVKNAEGTGQNMTNDERTELLVERYGECCTRESAAKILGRSSRTVSRMLEDKRLSPLCGGTMVDVRSVAAYMVNPAQNDFNARHRKRRLK